MLLYIGGVDLLHIQHVNKAGLQDRAQGRDWGSAQHCSLGRIHKNSDSRRCSSWRDRDRRYRDPIQQDPGVFIE